jgi:hypothetical protein
MAAPQPGPEAFAADRPGFPVTVDAQICEAIPVAVWNNSSFVSILASM